MSSFIGRAVLTLTRAYRINVAVTVGTDDDGQWVGRATPLSPTDAMDLQIGLEVLPDAWTLTYDDTTVMVNAEPDGERFYWLTEVED